MNIWPQWLELKKETRQAANSRRGMTLSNLESWSCNLRITFFEKFCYFWGKKLNSLASVPADARGWLLPALSPSLVLTAKVKIFISQYSAYNSTGRRKKTWHMTQLTFSSNFYWKICFKFCILEQIIATVLFICISSIKNKRSLLRFQLTTAPTNRGWSACAKIFN